jgi:hypothetical protein
VCRVGCTVGSDIKDTFFYLAASECRRAGDLAVRSYYVASSRYRILRPYRMPSHSVGLQAVKLGNQKPRCRELITCAIYRLDVDKFPVPVALWSIIHLVIAAYISM